MAKDIDAALLPGSPGLLLRAPFKQAGPVPGLPIHTAYLVPQIDTAHLRRYVAHLGFAPGTLPLAYFYLVAQRAHLASMLEPDYPFRIVGMIHLDNFMERQAEVDTARPLRVETEIRIDPPGPRGQVEVEFSTAFVQDGQPRILCRSRYLAVRGRRAKDGQGGQGRAAEDALPPVIAAWPLAADAGRAYAAVSGDWNPIHLWGWSARLMGMPAPIIHGMHTVSKACAEIERWSGRPVARMAVRFRAPAPLGSQVSLHAQPGSGRAVASCAGKIAMEGEFGLAVQTTR